MFKGLILKNYRNFGHISLEFSPSVNIFIGDNGQGKTNLLEALYVLSTGNSFRYADNENLIQKNSSEAHLKTIVFHGDFDYDVQISILKSRKNIFVQGKKVTTAELIKRFPTVIFSPESLAAIKEGADQRRQLVDEAMINFNSQNADLISEFRKCLKMRNKLLKDHLDGKTSKTQTQLLLESLNPSFLRISTELSYQRILTLNALLPYFSNAMQNISKNKNVDISVEYVISGENAMSFDLKNLRFCLEKRLNELSAAELASGTSLVGPQKHDIRFLYDQNDSRFYCSQGQQRALILSFKMAQIVYHRNAHGAYPVLMLDDVLSELDSEKRESLISFLSEINTQIFITTTDLNLPKDISNEAHDPSGKYGLGTKCSVIRITGGKIHDDRAHEQLWRGLHPSS
jgi:DNA replication and repair protein RecF